MQITNPIQIYKYLIRINSHIRRIRILIRGIRIIFTLKNIFRPHRLRPARLPENFRVAKQAN